MDYHRHTIRLANYNYTKENLYFITIGAYKHAHFWGEIKNNNFIPNEIGKIINDNLNLLSEKFDVEICDYQMMPNHLHVVLKINCRGLIYETHKNKIDISKTCKHMGLMNQTPTLGQIIRYLKGKCTYEIKQKNIKIPFLCEGHVWQRNYYERIIRNEKEYFKFKEYIKQNTINWKKDRNNLV